MRPWAWAAMLVIQLLTIAALIAQFVLDGFHWASLTGIIIPVLITLYLSRPKIRHAFSH